MIVYPPIYQSPISGVSPKPNANFHLSDLSGVQVTLIQGAVADLLQTQFAGVPGKPGDMVDVGNGLLARLTEHHFYLFGISPSANLPSAAALEASFRQADRFAHATDYSDGTAVLRLAGRAAAEVLSKICGLDFHPSMFPN